MTDHADIDHSGITGVGGSNLESSKITRSNGTNLTTNTSTWADMDSTNLSITMTTGAHRVMLVLTCSISGSNAAAVIGMNFSVDGTAVVTEAAGSKGLWSEACGTTMTGVTLVYITDVLTAASHTFRPRWNQRAGGGHTLTAFMDVAEEAIVFNAVELLAD